LTPVPVTFRLSFGLRFSRVLILAALIGTSAPALAQSLGGSGLPLPRFVTLRADEANLRAGPGTQYPVEWVYQRKGLPVEIIAEFEHWRRIRDSEGTVGWVHKSLLSGERGVIVVDGIQPLREAPAAEAPPVLHAEPGVIGELHACTDAWCRIDIEGHTGWIARHVLWGVYPDETYPSE